MKLKSILKTLPIETLESIHRFWEFNEPSAGQEPDSPDARIQRLVDFLYPRLQLKHSFVAAYGKLEAAEKDLIFFLAIHGGDLESKEVVDRCFGGSDDALASLADQLTQKGFVFQDTVELGRLKASMTGLPEPYLRYVELPSYWEGYLGNFLRTLPTASLKAMANRGLRLRLATSKKRLLIWRIRCALTDPKFIKKYVGQMPAEQRDILESLLEKRGISVYRDLLDQSYMRLYDNERASHIQALTSHSGIVFTAVAGENKQNDLLMVPRDLAYIIRSGYQPDNRTLQELDTVSMTQSEPRRLVLDNSGNLLRDLTVLMAGIRRRPPRVLASGGIGKNDLKKLLPDLSSRKTLKYARFIAHFCIRKKFLLTSGGFWSVSDSFAAWLESSQAAYRDFYDFWLNDTGWNEEYPDGDVMHADPPPSNLAHMPELRRMVLRNLESIPHSDWMDFDAFAEGLLPQIEIAMPSRRPGGEIPPLRHNILVIESVVAESLYWLGLAALGVKKAEKLADLGSRKDETLDPLVRHGVAARGKSTHDHAFVFKPTAHGQRILDSGVSCEPNRLFSLRGDGRLEMEMEAEQFTVQPNQEILAPPDLKLPYLYNLCLFCDVISVDVMSTLSISRRSLRAAMDLGETPENILEFLSGKSSTPPPETVRHLINECSSQHGELNMGYAGGYIHIGDRALFEEIRSHRHVRPWIKDVVGHRLIVLSPQTDIPRLAAELRKSGFMPRVDSENVHVADDGAFHLKLSPKELSELMGMLKFVIAMEDDFGGTLTDNKVRPLLERLRPGTIDRYNLAEFADTIGKTIARRARSARKKEVDQVAGRYKRQLARFLVSGSSLERPGGYRGPNPAQTGEEVRSLLEHAIDHETRVEIAYLHIKNGAIQDTIEPESLNNDKLYAYSDDRDGHAVFAVSRIQSAKLLV
jgi:hypothetical protein